MIKWLREWFTLRQRFNELQKAHDLRAVLNGRLHDENKRLRKGPRPKKTPGAQRYVEQMTAAHANKKALLHIESQRQHIITDLLRHHVTDAEFIDICNRVNAMTDEQVMCYKKL